MKELKAINLTKTYGEKTLLKDVSFIVHEKDRIGLIGTNGTGKSSLLHIIGQKDQSEQKGYIEVPSDYRISFLSQDFQLPEDKTVLEAVLTGNQEQTKVLKRYEQLLLDLKENDSDVHLQKQLLLVQEEMNAKNIWQLETRLKGILTQLKVPLTNKKVKELSGGQKKRVALAQALVEECDLLLLDEPTNHLDIEAITWLENFLKHYSGALIMITHDRYFLDRVTNRIFELDKGHLLKIKGNYQTYLVEKETLEQENKLQLQKNKRLYQQELEWMRAGVQARGTKQQARIQRFETLKSDLENQEKKEDRLHVDIATTRLGKKVFSLKKATFIRKEEVFLHDFDLVVQSHTRLGVIGKNGVGKSTFLNLLAGKLPLTSGVFEVGQTVKIAYYTQQMETIPEDMRMITYLQSVAEEVKNTKGEKIAVVDMLERFLFPRYMHGTKIHKLSGGEKRRLYLLKLLMEQPNVLLLDEPTNDLDIQTLTILEDYLQEFPGSVIAVSHDRYFLDKTMTQLLIFKGKGKTDLFFGTMSAYLQTKQEESDKLKPVRLEKTQRKENNVQEKTKLTYMEQKEWETIEEDIEQLEQKTETIQEEMNHFGSDFSKLNRLQSDLEDIQKQLDEKMERWEYLAQFQ